MRGRSSASPTLLIILLLACTGDKAGGGSLSPGGEETGDVDSGGADGAAEELPWGEGERAVSGQAFFFDMPSPPTIEQMMDVEGAEVYVWEAPELRAALDPAEGHRFRIEGIPEGAAVTLALTQPDYYPSLTATLPVEGEDLEGISFQGVTRLIAGLAAGLLGADADDSSRCQMSTTVSAAGAVDVWAVGEPDATVTIEPAVLAEQGPYYFNTSVIPDPTLSATTTDGGVVVAGAEPGTYVWTAHKDGVEFAPLTLPCEGGWLTNAAPPYGLNVVGD